MEYQIEENSLTIFLPAELDHCNAEQVRKRADMLIEHNHIKYVIFDFANTNFMDSSGIGVIIGRYKKISMRSGEVNIISVSKSIKRVFELSGIFKIIKYYENLDEALKVG